MRLIFILFFCCSCYAIDTANTIYDFTAGTAARAAQVLGNDDSLQIAINKAVDTINNNIPRFNTLQDSNIILDTVLINAIRSNPDVDSLQGDSIVILADIRSSAFNYNLSSIDADTIRADGASGLFLFDDGDNGLFIPDGGGLGVGIASLNTWTTYTPIRIGGVGSVFSTTTQAAGNVTILSNNFYYDGDIKRIINDELSYLQQGDGIFKWFSADTGQPDIAVSPNEVMRINLNGFVGIDTTAPGSKFHVAGSIRARDTMFADVYSVDTAAFTVMDADTASIDSLLIKKIRWGFGGATISSNAITFTQGSMNIGTEASVALDTLETINGGQPGDWLLIKNNSSVDDIFIATTGNINANDGNGVTLDNARDMALLVFFDVIGWNLVSFMSNVP